MSGGTSEYWRKLIKADETPSEEFLEQFRSPLEKFRPIFYSIINFLCKFYWRVEVYGVENIPASPPYIIAPNHASALDQTMVSYAIGGIRRDQLYTIVVKHFFDRPAARFFMRIATNVMRIDSKDDFMPALRAALKVLKLKRSIYINPEGTRSMTGELLPFRVGVGMLAAETGVPIVPVFIGGTYDSMPPGKYFPKPRKVTVTFGKPICMDEYMDKKQNEMAYDVYKAITDELFKRVSSLKIGQE